MSNKAELEKQLDELDIQYEIFLTIKEICELNDLIKGDRLYTNLSIIEFHKEQINEQLENL